MKTDNRHVVHFDLDSFFVSVERLMNSRLNGVPVIVGGMSDRGVVAACSYEARQFGVHSAMPMKLARRLCPHAFYVRGDMDEYSRYSRMVTQIIDESAPLYEKASIDEHYLDLTGMDRFYGCLKWSHELRNKIIRETGLPISFGLSVNKTVSKIATGEAKPNGEKQVLFEEVKPFLWPLSISKIPMIGPATYKLLRSMGIERIETLGRMPPEMLHHAMGKNGLELWRRANGIDLSPVEPYTERKSISSERTFEQDTGDMKMLMGLVVKMTEKLAYQLRAGEKLTGCITVKIKYSDFDTRTLQKTVPYTSFDHLLIPIAKELLTRLYTRRVMIRLIGVKLSHLVSGAPQLDLFEDTPRQVQLYRALDYVRHRYGAGAVGRAV
ncbi:DNA polymerase IV [Marinilabilia salmonicolor]|jgi:DNA polymerase-4|uniref:DNA polymerase IV n=1 Tax=Marinilabilia salmonicolor TaxID=989 RepID=A0A2T0XN55_9BACT|nr:DNA polymerase IV [Marinilabilia salmonicolor]PRZ00312.1 DNA polymerase-4 [Marinilabilia salmonicolor]RCW38428.1 DNA polymerase-4 [Marinilabilia salmonicolor]